MKAVLSADMKDQNRMLVYQTIQARAGQRVTRTEIKRETGISGTTILKIFEFLESRGIIRPAGSIDSPEPGRRAGAYCFVPESAYALGASYDGGVLELSLVNLNYETVRRTAVELRTDVSTLIARELSRRVRELGVDLAKVLGLGISLPASVDGARRRISYQAVPGLYGRMSKEDLSAECAALEDALGLPVLLENDVNCAAVAEYRARELPEGEDLAYIMLGGGVGAGLILDGALRRGGSFSCGEIAYMVWDKNFSARSGYGYLEHQLYGRAQSDFGVDLLSAPLEKVPASLLEHAADELSLAIANLSNALDITRFILGGRTANRFGAELLDAICSRLERLCVHNVDLSAAKSQDNCARGAASLLIDRELPRLLSDVRQTGSFNGTRGPYPE